MTEGRAERPDIPPDDAQDAGLFISAARAMLIHRRDNTDEPPMWINSAIVALTEAMKLLAFLPKDAQ